MAYICAVEQTLTAYTEPSPQEVSYKRVTGLGRIHIEYWVHSNLPDRITIASKAVAQSTITYSDYSDTTSSKCLTKNYSSQGYWIINGIKYYIPTDYSAVASGATGASATADLSSVAYTTIYKTKSEQSISVAAFYGLSMEVTCHGNRKRNSWDVWPSGAFTIDHIQQYTVQYNANGGSGAPSSQLIWYGEALKLRTNTPTRTGWIFQGWATSSTGSVAYAAGANYTTDANVILYAVWKRETYSVTYNANGGSGAPSAQTKQYGIDLTLSSNVPTFSGYAFKGWAISTANAGVGTIDYAKGGTYKGNSALTLYAVWELTYRKPILSNISIERCTQSGTLDDEGDCALVSFDWTVFRSSLSRYYGGNTYPYANNAIGTDGCSITVGSHNALRNSTDASGHMSVVVGSAYSSDIAYGATISLTDSQTFITEHTTTATGTLPTQYFPMDFNEDATTVGFFMPAPPNNEGAHFGKDVHIYIDTAAASGTDHTIYQWLVALGWTSVLE